MNGLQVYYPDDIRNALLAAEQATGEAIGLEANRIYTDRQRGYAEGYRAALTTIAIAFGLVKPQGKADFTALDMPRQNNQDSPAPL